MPKKNPIRVAEKLMNTPHLVTPSFADYAFNFLNNKEAALQVEKQERKADKPISANGKVGLLSLEGPLTYKTTGWEMICGGMSYQLLLQSVDELIADGVSTIVLDVDSPGGEAYGMMETARDIRKRCDDAGVKLVAYVDGLCASAAYGISCVADELILNQEAEAGSIGVVTRLSNKNRKDKQDGIDTTYIYAGDNKIPFDEEGAFREDFLKELQSKVDTLYANFTAHVAEYRNMSVEDVKNTKAGVFMAEDAVKIGLADKIMSRDEFYAYLSSNNEGGNMSLGEGKIKEIGMEDKLKAELEEARIAALKEAEAKFNAEKEQMLAELNKFKAIAAELERKQEEAAKSEIEEVISAYAFLSEEEKTSLSSFLFKNRTSEDCKMILGVLESANNQIVNLATQEHGHAEDAKLTSDQMLSTAFKEVLNNRKK